MFPRFGYTTAAWDPPKPPGRNLDRVGEVVLTTLAGSLSMRPRKTEPEFGGVPASWPHITSRQGQCFFEMPGGSVEARSDTVSQSYTMRFCDERGEAINGSRRPHLPKKFSDTLRYSHSNPMSRGGERWVMSRCSGTRFSPKETTDALILELAGQFGPKRHVFIGTCVGYFRRRLLEFWTAGIEPGDQSSC